MQTSPDRADILSRIEHTLLSAAATTAQVEALCDEALTHGFFGVCVNPLHVARCRARLEGTAARVVTVVGFPLSASFLEVTTLECRMAVDAGADEIDAVMRVGAAKAGDWVAVERDAAALVAAASGLPVKLILETAQLSDDEKLRGCAAALAAGVAFVKTSTGFGGGGATVADVILMAEAVRGRAGVKASGGIRSAADARAMCAAGADRLGTSSGVAIARELA